MNSTTPKSSKFDYVRNGFFVGVLSTIATFGSLAITYLAWQYPKAPVTQSVDAPSQQIAVTTTKLSPSTEIPKVEIAASEPVKTEPSPSPVSNEKAVPKRHTRNQSVSPDEDCECDASEAPEDGDTGEETQNIPASSTTPYTVHEEPKPITVRWPNDSVIRVNGITIKQHSSVTVNGKPVNQDPNTYYSNVTVNGKPVRRTDSTASPEQ